MASTTSKPPSKPVQALIVYNRYCWCADEVCVIVLSLRYYYMHFLQSCQDGVLLFSVLKVVQGGRIRTMVIAPASHFRRGFSVGEIHCLRRLNREGSPKRFSRS